MIMAYDFTPAFPHLKQVLLVLAPNRLTLFGTTGCQTSYANPGFQVGQIYDVSQQRVITFETLLPHLLDAEVIFIGEEHYTPSHLQAAEQVLEALRTHQRRPALAMEMFAWDGQPGLDRYLKETDVSLETLLEESHWKSNWEESSRTTRDW